MGKREGVCVRPGGGVSLVEGDWENPKGCRSPRRRVVWVVHLENSRGRFGYLLLDRSLVGRVMYGLCGMKEIRDCSKGCRSPRRRVLPTSTVG
jgi:hypothetical protein